MKFICTSHDEAIAKLEELYDLKLIDINDFWNTINDAMALIKEAKESGIRMEAGLDRKRNRIEQLENEVSSLEKEALYLKNQVEDIPYLEDKVRVLQIQLEEITNATVRT